MTVLMVPCIMQSMAMKQWPGFGALHVNCVVGIDANAMSPAIENDGSPSGHLHLVGNGDCSEGSMWCDFIAGGEILLNWCNGGIGMLKSSLHAGEHFNAVVVSSFKCAWKFDMVCCATSLSFHLSMVLWKMPVFLKTVSVRCIAVASVIALLPATAKIWHLKIHFHKSLIDSLGVHSAVRQSLLASRSMALISPYIVLRCTNMACGVSVAKPMVLNV